MPHPHRLTAGLLGVLGFIAAVGPFATDMYLSSFTEIATELGTGPAPVQLTLTAFLIGMSVGQLFNGPLSDRFGRRPVLLVALGVFAAASIAMVFSPAIEAFVALRLVQGLAGSAGVVIARAIATDLSAGDTAVRALSLIAMVTALGPLVAPPIGGAIATWIGWRGVLAALAVVALAMLLLALLRVPESHPPEERPPGRRLDAFRRFGGLLRDGAFTSFALAFAFGFAAMMSYISASPFVGQRVLGMSGLEYSFSFAAAGAALVLANLSNARLAPRFGVRRMLAVGIAAVLAAGVGFAALSITGALSPASFVPCAFVLTAGTGYPMANASALALARTVQASRGAGSALVGASQFAFGALASPLVGLWGERTAVPMALCVLVAGAVSAVFALVALRSSRAEG
ncbi:multidrug effflux MFS transporter [Gulosibacter sp. 10]|uniref:multidrug effflux MFS transporter n=1 Tax=Gulosibacter sp. 10 TaxID=1255570 RepID=UPI00097F521E|nr:multidrug effflux MFS transporter [Gulosibacter sp. 10]SJM56166.1 membrane transport protein [Gulosibacter sp. 10]